ncbi:MAG: two-component system, OmpR family, sensor histidine kinase CiaH [Parcubacteria bacterium C7867-008]|nr:MAG: two-component system, OmpR family, sensor histidine kinase CiaH [Parcubacteria bacterium C7867-008]
MPTPSSKRFEVLGTDLTDKYRNNPYVKSTVHIIALQIVLTILTIAVFGWGLQYSQTQIVGSISEHIAEAMRGGITNSNTLSHTITEVRTDTIAYVFVILILLTVVFGFLAARFALRPTRDSLQFQKRFIGNVAHEIRTPLAIIKTSTEVALMDPRVSTDIRETLTQTITELDRISETINNLLSFDNLIRPGRIKSECVDVASLIRTVSERHHALADSRGVMLRIHIPDGEYMVLGNAVALDQVLTNLIKNAINYTPENKGGSVSVSIEADYRGRIIISIVDTGIGIAQKDLYHIFEPFYRAETSRNRGVGGGTSGLGLAIVNEIVRLHRGTITVRSAVGHGTTMELCFPNVNDPSNKRRFKDHGLDETVQEVQMNLG